MIWWVLTNVYTQVAITTTRDPDHHFSSLVYILAINLQSPSLALGNHWSAFYHFRLDLSFLEFPIKKWPFSPTIKFLFYLKSQFGYLYETFLDFLWLSSLFYFVQSLLYYNLFLYIFISLTKLYDPWGQVHVFIHLFSRFIIKPGV